MMMRLSTFEGLDICEAQISDDDATLWVFVQYGEQIIRIDIPATQLRACLLGCEEPPVLH